jgi:hypothetical protein
MLIADDDHVAGYRSHARQRGTGISFRRLDGHGDVPGYLAIHDPEDPAHQLRRRLTLLGAVEVQHHPRVSQVPMAATTVPGETEGPRPYGDKLRQRTPGSAHGPAQCG